MKTAKLFKNGRSQAIRLPKEYRFEDEEVYVNKIGKMVIIMPKDKKWTQLVSSLDEFSDDYLKNRNQPKNQNRKDL